MIGQVIDNQGAQILPEIRTQQLSQPIKLTSNVPASHMNKTVSP